MEEQIRLFILYFLSVLYQALPFVVLGSVVAGILEELVPQQLIARLVPRNRPLAIAMSCLLGIVFPMCECGIVAVLRRLLRKGLPLSCCVAYMLAGPIINFIVISSTVVAFYSHDNGWLIVTCRIVFGFIVAFTTGLVVEREYRKHGLELVLPSARPVESPAGALGLDVVDVADKPLPAWKRTSNIAETALHDFIDITVFLILGATLSAITGLLVSREQVELFGMQYPVVAILGAMGMAVLLCLCSEADAFVAASFTTLSASAKIGFLVLGPMLDLKLYLMFTRVFRGRLIGVIVVCVVGFTFALSVLFHYVYAAVLSMSGPG